MRRSPWTIHFTGPARRSGRGPWFAGHRDLEVGGRSDVVQRDGGVVDDGGAGRIAEGAHEGLARLGDERMPAVDVVGRHGDAGLLGQDSRRFGLDLIERTLVDCTLTVSPSSMVATKWTIAPPGVPASHSKVVAGSLEDGSSQVMVNSPKPRAGW